MLVGSASATRIFAGPTRLRIAFAPLWQTRVAIGPFGAEEPPHAVRAVQPTAAKASVRLLPGISMLGLGVAGRGLIVAIRCLRAAGHQPTCAQRTEIRVLRRGDLL